MRRIKKISEVVPAFAAMTLLGVALGAVGACGSSMSDAQGERETNTVATAGAHAEARTGAHAKAHAEAHAEGYIHGDAADSDLDRPVAELFETSCEHGVKTHACGQCRYEVGVVKVPRSVFDEGLLTVGRAQRERVGMPLVLTGGVAFDERRVTHVGTLVEGIIRRVDVAPGQRVRRGQILLEIESVAVGEAEAELLAARAELDLALRNHDRLAGLRAEAIAAEKDYLQAAQALAAARIREAGARGRLVRLGAVTADSAELTSATAHGRLVLRATVDGTILAMHAVPGEVARAEEPLLTLGDNRVVWVWADLYERDLARFAGLPAHSELPAAVTVKAYPDREFAGTVAILAAAMSEATRTVKLRIEVPNPEGLLLAGMFASVKVLLPGEEESVTLPVESVLEDEGRWFVFVHHHDDYFVRRPVVRGRVWGDRVAIIQGLAGGETVVTEGAFLLKSDVLRAKMGAGCAD